MTKGFYYVAKDCPYTRINKRHTTLESAIAEAHRLTIKENKRFFVLSTVYVCTPIISSMGDELVPDDLVAY